MTQDSGRNHQKITNTGFSLIEMSIVIILIGVAMGGFVLGLDLIHSGKIKSVIKQKDLFDSAANTFKDKYKCLPSDCKNWIELGFVQDGNRSYKGDGIIDNDEKLFFWDVLYTAGLIDPVWESAYLPDFAASYLGRKGFWDLWSPKDHVVSAGGDGSFLSLPEKNYYWLRAETTIEDFPNKSAAVFIPADAQAIDTKIDDGIPESGDVIATGDRYGYKFGNKNNAGSGPWKPIAANGGEHNNACLDNSKTLKQYNTPNKNRISENMCGLLIKTGF